MFFHGAVPSCVSGHLIKDLCFDVYDGPYSLSLSYR